MRKDVFDNVTAFHAKGELMEQLSVEQKRYVEKVIIKKFALYRKSSKDQIYYLTIIFNVIKYFFLFWFFSIGVWGSSTIIFTLNGLQIMIQTKKTWIGNHCRKKKW